ncbi:MAG: M48 family metalloprotease [Candidatus Krumholzibacteriia bacterium]
MFEAIAANRRKSAFLVVLMAVLLAALGYALGELYGKHGGPVGVAIAAVVWLVLTLVAYAQGDQIFLSMSGARKIGPQDLPVLWNVVEEMTLAAGLPRMPSVYVIDDPAPNAFATGRSPETASVAVTAGLLKRLDRDELQGVIAHELGHIKNRDILLMLFAGVLMGAIVLLADVGLRSWLWGGGRSRRSSNDGGGAQIIFVVLAIVLMILAPLMAQLVYFAVSRRREYLADASSAVFTRYPEGLARALEKIAAAPPSSLRGVSRATAPMYIVNPLAAAAKQSNAAALTATHPPVAERIRILRSMSGASLADYDAMYNRVTGKGSVVPKASLADDPHAGAGLRIQGAQWREGQAAAPTAATAAPAAPAAPARARARSVDDFFYGQDGWGRLTCQCGAVLKVPPQLHGVRLRCPRCRTEHQVR